MRAARRVLQTWASSGWNGLLERSIDALRRHRPIDEFYPEWIRRYDTPTERTRDGIRREMAQWPAQPLISVIVLVQSADPRPLLATVSAVRAQLYPHWELCICGKASTLAGVREELSCSAQADRRIRLRLSENSDGARPSMNDALALATGALVTLVDCNDLIPEHALYWVVKELVKHPDADLIFSDEDCIDAEGRRFRPSFKPDWNPALMMSRNAVGRLAVLRRSLVEKVGNFMPDASHDYGLVLRCARGTQPERIRHIARVLYHRRAAAADNTQWEAGQRAIAEHLADCGTRATVGRAGRNCYQVEYALPSPPPPVSILLSSTCEAHLIEPCLQSLLTRTSYQDFEILLLVNERHRVRAAELAARLASARLRPLFYPDRPFNYSWVSNWGADQAAGELLCFLNDDTTIITPDWIERLAARTSLPGVAAAGAMLLYPDETIQHAGVILGLGGIAGHACRGLPRGSCGYLDRGCLEQDVSCVTAACMMMRSGVFRRLGGFDEALAIAFNDVDLCIRVRAAGWRIIWTPTVELYHREAASTGSYDSRARAGEFAREFALMRKRWGPVLDVDPFYNPNLSTSRAFHLACPPRA